MSCSRHPITAIIPKEHTLIKVTKRGNLVPNLPTFLKGLDSKQYVFVIPVQEDTIRK